jgi:MFS family permease
LNALVALLGYFVAALIVDKPAVGRLRLQQWGFLFTGFLFCACGIFYNKLSNSSLVVMYLGSSFFGQCGPNATTFLIPAEIFPTEMRTMCHGISASAGKVGALIAAILFNYVSGVQMFLISGYASFAACFITFVAIPETSTLDLYEIDRRWRMIIDGRKMDYDGPANNPEHLSFYERSKIGLNY